MTARSLKAGRRSRAAALASSLIVHFCLRKHPSMVLAELLCCQHGRLFVIAELSRNRSLLMRWGTMNDLPSGKITSVQVAKTRTMVRPYIFTLHGAIVEQFDDMSIPPIWCFLQR
jgi:hypothetical protein